MTRAYILIKTAVEMTEQVQAKLQEIPGVRAADIVTGDTDLIVVVEAPTPQDIGHLVMSTIRGLDGIEATTTSIVVG